MLGSHHILNYQFCVAAEKLRVHAAAPLLIVAFARAIVALSHVPFDDLAVFRDSDAFGDAFFHRNANWEIIAGSFKKGKDLSFPRRRESRIHWIPALLAGMT